MTIKRTHTSGHLSEIHQDQRVNLCGWVDRWRDHGGVIFIDLRDRSGIVQIVFDPGHQLIQEASRLRQEFVIAVSGKVRLRPSGMQNDNLSSGKIEVLVDFLELLNKSEPLPYSLHEDNPSFGEVDESLRMTYRYLELRRSDLQRNLKLRSEFLRSARNFYAENQFWEIETPILYKSTPEGARDYLVPSRVHPSHFYALPQSPQTLKQLCMIGGIERYYQVARCFRDEDLRADRQPEFTQIDVELSFTDDKEIQELHEQLMKRVFKDVLGKDIVTPFRRMKYHEALLHYGSDKPDLRVTLKLTDLSLEAKMSDFQVYRTQIEAGGILKALCFEEKEPLSRSELDQLIKKVSPYGAKGITWIRIKESGDWQSPQAKFFSKELKSQVESKIPFSKNCMLFLVCGKQPMVDQALSALRVEYGRRFGYLLSDPYHFLWIEDFPLLEFNDEDHRFYAAHHPFTSPHQQDQKDFLETEDPKKLARVRAQAYDLVLNGYEIGGGSIRIHDSLLQSRMFDVLGISKEEAQKRFGFFLRALQFGTPPHGGIALGVDRISMILAGTDAIRDVIAFPKTQKASDLMADCPSQVDSQQLKELHIRVVE